MSVYESNTFDVNMSNVRYQPFNEWYGNATFKNMQNHIHYIYGIVYVYK